MPESSKISYRLRDEQLTKTVHTLSVETQNIVITDHAEDRMFDRQIGFPAVLEILRKGVITFERTDEKGNCVVRATKNVIGSRDTSVVTAVIDSQRKLILITVMWEDEK